MLKKSAPVLLLSLLMLVAACETTGNPRLGGLFQWDENQAQQRINQRQANLAALKQAQAAEQARTRQLQQQQQQKAAQVAQIRRDLNRLDADISRIRRDIRNFRAQTRDQQDRKAQLEQQLSDLKVQVDQVRADNAMSEADKRAEIKRLKQEIATLMEMASLLTTQ